MYIIIMLNNYFSVLEVYQFARDAAVAEAWLLAQEPYIMSLELGVCYLYFNYIKIIILRFFLL